MDKFSINWRRVGLIAGAAFLALLVIEFNNRLNELNHLNEEAQKYRTQLAQATQTFHALETQVAYASSDAAAEDRARDTHNIQEKDIPVQPVGPGNSPPTPTPTPAPIPTPPPNWQVWWNLFFGE